jgi:hypothetical protein
MMRNDKPAIDNTLDPDYRDPFLDDNVHLDLRPDPVEPDLGSPLDPTLGPDDLEPQEEPTESDEPVASAPEPEPPANDEPEFIDYGDGMSATVEKKKGWWVATLNIGQGVQPQVFKGKTKNEMFKNLMKGQIEATKKIREQNRHIKLGNVRETDAAPVNSPVSPPVRELTADDVFEIKTQLESNPDLAFDTWFQKKTGMSVGQLAQLASEGRTAKVELEAEQESKEFMAEHPDYIACVENVAALYGWLTKKYLGKVLTERNAAELVRELKLGGFHTASNLAAAYEDLTDGGLLILKAEEDAQTETEEPTPVAAAPTPTQGSRIAKPRGPKLPAAYGLPANASSVARPAAQGVSDDDLDNLSDEEIRKLYYDNLKRQREQRYRR